jgi:hypothetical protein
MLLLKPLTWQDMIFLHLSQISLRRKKTTCTTDKALVQTPHPAKQKIQIKKVPPTLICG